MPPEHRCPTCESPAREERRDLLIDGYPCSDPWHYEPRPVVSTAVEPCPVCGVQGACAYDAEGRPLIHTDTELPEHEAPR